ncbi:portal protein [Catenovulum sediminis]|uniref:Portal protein n=1 Tax=Catenovulum sediminis TaxID=1740262 RepID=A0ABV1RBN0_9ALTE
MSILYKATATQLDQQDKERERQRFENANPPIHASNLANHVRQCWEVAKSAKLDVTTRLTDCLYRKKGEYPPEHLEKIRKAGVSDIYMKITGNKIRSAKAWLSDLFSPTGERPFTLKPTPIPELPPNLKESLVNTAIQSAINDYGIPEQHIPEFLQSEDVGKLLDAHEDRLIQELEEMAENRAEKASEYIEDMLIEGDWRTQFDMFLDDLVTFPSAIIKAPILRYKKKLKWIETPEGYKPQMVKQIVREVKRVSPYDFYPSPNSTGIDNGWHIEHIRFTPSELANLRGVKGYNTLGIANALIQHRVSGLKEWAFNEGERERLEGRRKALTSNNETIDGIEFTGKLQGKMLIEHGLPEDVIDDPVEEYPVSVVLVGNHIIRAMLNPNPTGRPGYYKASWDIVPGSFWGVALPEIMSDTQDACNISARSLMNNMSMASGPQVSVDVAARPASESITKIVPWKVWRYDGNKSKNAGVDFFMPEMKANELMSVYERFVRYADEITGLPSYAFGSDQGAGAAKTASGLSMLMNASSKTIKSVVRNVDIGVIEPLIESMYITLMLDPEVPEDAKGDVRCKARGSDSLVHKESLMMRQQELLTITNNPVDMQIIGMEGRREQLKEVYKTGSIPSERIIPSQEELAQKLTQQANLEDPANNEQHRN